MQYIEFPEANTARTAPKGMEETVGTLPVYSDGEQCISCWQLSEEEIRLLIQNDGKLYLGCLTGISQPPVFLSVEKPAMPEVVHEVTPTVVDGLRQFAARLPEYAGSRPVPGAVLLRKQPDLRRPDGQPLDPKRRYFVSSPEAQIQHLANLCEAHKRGGMQGAVDYLKPYANFLGTEQSEPAQ